MLLQELVEVRHELVDRLAHVHVAELRPHAVRIGQRRHLVLVPDLRLELVPDRAHPTLSYSSQTDVDASDSSPV